MRCRDFFLLQFLFAPSHTVSYRPALPGLPSLACEMISDTCARRDYRRSQCCARSRCRDCRQSRWTLTIVPPVYMCIEVMLLAGCSTACMVLFAGARWSSYWLRGEACLPDSRLHATVLMAGKLAVAAWDLQGIDTSTKEAAPKDFAYGSTNLIFWKSIIGYYWRWSLFFSP
jgi:hypothetical protein